MWTLMSQRPSVYVTTIRRKDQVRNDLDEALPDAEYTVRHAGMDTPIRNASDVIELVDRQANVMIDSANPLETTGDHERYVKFLNGLKDHMVNTDSMAMLVCSKSDTTNEGREFTLSVADVVWELRTSIEGTSIENYLFVRKYRGATLPEETIKVQLGREVAVDTSRDIA